MSSYNSNLDYIFQPKYPQKLWSKSRWHLNENIYYFLPILNLSCGILTIKNRFNGLGDTLLQGMLAKNLCLEYPNIRINCISPHPNLLEGISFIHSINNPETFWSIDFWYLDSMDMSKASAYILDPLFEKLGLQQIVYQPEILFENKDLEIASKLISQCKKPVITINTQTKEFTKNWPKQHWEHLILLLTEHFDIIQIGDEQEISLNNVLRLAGKLSIRETAALLSLCNIHIGGVSFLMHLARAVNTPAVIIYGGRETVENSGYSENINLYKNLECSPCWIHSSEGERCPNDMKCMKQIRPKEVLKAVTKIVENN
tara:strand:+ start:15388 stop:16332 length:945 start_codon:yes stop_codon:yes gene_type:complete